MSMLLSIQDLQVRFRLGRVDGVMRHGVAVGAAVIDDRPRPAPDSRATMPPAGSAGISFDVPENTTVALVGESGSGKSVTAMSILNLLPDNAERSGRILFQGRDLLQASAAELRALRGRQIACVFQDPMSSLNPVLSIGRQLMEPLRLHLGLSGRAARERAEALLNEVGLPEPRRRLDAYAHELSGGQQQRVMIAMALACEPKLLIADEPTTALDVTVQRQILALLAELKAHRRMSLLFISHDLGVVGEIADRVVVLRHGRIREQGPVAQIFSTPQDAYTRALLACRPRLDHNPARLPVIDEHMAAQAETGGHAAPDQVPAPATPATGSHARPDATPDTDTAVLLDVRQLAKSFFIHDGWFGRREFKAMQPLSFQLRRGRTLGVVGESGSGKTTLGLTLLHLHEPTGGEVLLGGRSLLALQGAERQQLRRRIQIVFQNPYAALNPRFTIGQTLLEPLQIHQIGADDIEREQRALALLQQVGLDAGCLAKYPHEFSGGQRQRIAIARALTLAPEVLILDEAVSALDVSVQAQVLNLLKDLQARLGLAYVFISHDLAVVRFMADEVLVMKDGQVVERGATTALLAAPQRDYTRQLLAAIPHDHRQDLSKPASSVTQLG
ncbi:MAG: ABC transporter ATP-binding protein [Leptothrix sp. (in: b-proteobacteria)]